MMDVQKDIASMKTDLKYMVENCKAEKACLGDIDQRVEKMETRWKQLDGAWKLLMLGISAGVISFLIAFYNWLKITFGV